MKREEGKHFRKIHARMQAHLDVLKQVDAYRKLSPHETFLLARDKGKWEETPSTPLAALFGDIETIKTLISDDRLQQFNTGAKNGALARALPAPAPAWRQTASRSTLTMQHILASRHQLPEFRKNMSPKKVMPIFFLAVLLAGMPTNSTVIRTLDVASLTSQSDIIVIGKILSVTDRGPTTLDPGSGPIPASAFEAVLQVDHLLKGSPHAQNLFVDFVLPKVPIGIQGVVSGQYGLFFLAALQNELRFTDPMQPSLPAVRNAKLAPGTAQDQVTIALGQVLVAPQVPDADLFWALDALGRLKTDLARDTLRQALKSSSGNVHLDVARTLVARNDVAGLEPVESALLHPAGLSNTMISNLAGSLGGLKDPKSIPTLKRLLGTNNPQITKGVAIALRQSGSADALEPLSHLLNDGDEQVRYYAVVGLGEITNQDEWTPAFDEFRNHEAKYLTYWRDWAASNLQLL